jgi:hypothetical protein
VGWDIGLGYHLSCLTDSMCPSGHLEGISVYFRNFSTIYLLFVTLLDNFLKSQYWVVAVQLLYPWEKTDDYDLFAQQESIDLH